MPGISFSTEVDLSNQNDLTGYHFASGSLNPTTGEIDLIENKLKGTHFTSNGASFYAAVGAYVGNNTNKVSLTDNAIEFSDVHSSSISHIAAASATYDLPFVTNSRSSFDLNNNSVNLKDFEDITLNLIAGAYATIIGYKNSEGSVSFKGNSVLIDNSSNIKINQDSNGRWGIYSAYASVGQDSSLRDWFAQNFNLTSNSLTINNTQLNASETGKTIANVSGANLEIFASPQNTRSPSNTTKIVLDTNSLDINGGEFTGKTSLYGAHLKSDYAASNRAFSLQNNTLTINKDINKSNIDISGLISAGMADFFGDMWSIPTIELNQNMVEIHNSSVKSSANDGKGFLAGAFAYAHNVYATNQSAATSPDLSVTGNSVVAANSTITSFVYGGFAVSQGGGENKINMWENISEDNKHNDYRSEYGLNAGKAITDNNHVNS